MWTLLSFTSRFDVKYLETALGEHQPKMPGEKTDEEKQLIREAQLARAKLRRGKMLQCLQDRLSKGKEAKGMGKSKARPLNHKQLQILQEYSR